ncbi:MAG: hypothetical protein U5K76_08575 [Woeseiaceae bacterium]|nr:hypothetical protein [Woeseiaceae bacterium]
MTRTTPITRREETTLRGKTATGRPDQRTGTCVTLAGLYADIDDGYDAFAIDNSLTMRSDKPGRDAQESVGASLRADWHASERVDVRRPLRSAADSTIDFSFDADWGNDDFWAPFTYDFTTVSDRERRTASQELRLASGPAGRLFGDRADWLVGVYVQRLEDLVTTRNEGIYVDPGSGFNAVDRRPAGQRFRGAQHGGVRPARHRRRRRRTDYVRPARRAPGYRLHGFGRAGARARGIDAGRRTRVPARVRRRPVGLRRAVERLQSRRLQSRWCRKGAASSGRRPCGTWSSACARRGWTTRCC